MTGAVGIAVIGAPPVTGTPVTTPPVVGAVGITTTGAPPVTGTAITGAVAITGVAALAAVMPGEAAAKVGAVDQPTPCCPFTCMPVPMTTPGSVGGFELGGLAGEASPGEAEIGNG